jgi:phosphomannomutase
MPILPADALRAAASRWIADDPDPATQRELRGLLDRRDLSPAELADLEDRFVAPLAFGTAGLRGVMGAGPNRMNRAVVARATWALAEVLRAEVPGAASRGVVVGGDARRMSPELAQDVAAILAAAGLRVVLFGRPVPTPLVGFTVKRLAAAAGVVVTASHNPPQYNGYKVYWANAAQIVPPVDGWIAAAIARAPPARAIERPSLEAARGAGLLADAPADAEDAYVAAVADLALHPGQGDRALRVVYTPLHGVGDRLARRVLADGGFSDVRSVPEQRAPDAAFPTVAFPNPEEPGAMDLAFSCARGCRADLVLANDPDADRLAVGIPDGGAGEAQTSGVPAGAGYRALTGNEVGVLLGHYLLNEGARPRTAKGRAVLASIVSSPWLGRIAASLGAHYEETLTGFKWIADRAIALEAEGYDVVFGYEEALGYSVGNVVRDKDGISAALLVAELAAVTRARGGSLATELDAIAQRHGLYVSAQVNVTRAGPGGPAAIAALMESLRSHPPARFGDDSVRAIVDYAEDGAPGLSIRLPKSNVLAFHLASGARVIARPSGTEPKAKLYFDVPEEVDPGEPVAVARARAQGNLTTLKAGVVRALGLG